MRKFPEALGEYPVSVLAEEIATPGEGQIKVMITAGGNPVLSTPNTLALEDAMKSLEFMISVDIYLNETTRYADVILPPPSHLERSHFDLVFTGFSIRNVANYSEPVFERDPSQPDEWEIFLKIAGIAQGMGAGVDPAVVDDFTLDAFIGSIMKDSSSPTNGLTAEQVREQLDATGARGADRMLDLMLRTGPYGDGFGENANGISLQHMKQHPHGIDFGPLEPRLPEMLRTVSGKVELAPPALLADLPRLEQSMHEVDDEQLVLVGRRHLRSNNSWMHNIEVLVKGKPRCTLQMHPNDAARIGVKEGEQARITSRVGHVDAVVEFTSDIRERVVSLPHGWGHDVSGTQMNVAAKRAGVNSNVLTDHNEMDPLSGNSVMNGIPVTVSALV